MAKMGTSLIDRTNRFLFGGGRRNARPWIRRLELTAYEPRAWGKPNFQDNAESTFEDDYSIGSKASGRVFGEGLPSNVRSCVRRNSRPARVVSFAVPSNASEEAMHFITTWSTRFSSRWSDEIFCMVSPYPIKSSPTITAISYARACYMISVTFVAS